MSTSKGILDLPLDASVTFRPTRILYLRPSAEKKEHSQILDLNTHLHTSYNEAITPEFHDLTQRTLRANPVLPPTWTLTRASRLSASHLAVTDPSAESSDHRTVADIRSHLLSFGTTHIQFPADSSHSTHEITVKPLSVKSRAQSFVKDSVSYVWATMPLQGETDSGSKSRSGKLSLFKAIAGKKFQVAAYESASGKFELGGVLVVEEREIDALVAVLTLVGVLSQHDSFYAPGMDLVG